MIKDISYEKAFSELQQILLSLQNEQTSIDELAAQSQKANQLIAYCRAKLKGIEETVSENDF